MPDPKKDSKRFFQSEYQETAKTKPFAKRKSQLFLEDKQDNLAFIKPSKSDNEMTKNEVLNEKHSTVFTEEKEVQIIEKRNSYNDYWAEIIGYMLLIVIFVLFTCFGVAFLLRVFDVRTNNIFFDFLADDLYYCMLLPMIIPITTIAIYGNWVAMKFFRHS